MVLMQGNVKWVGNDWLYVPWDERGDSFSGAARNADVFESQDILGDDVWSRHFIVFHILLEYITQ
jgi:hypothetical protein